MRKLSLLTAVLLLSCAWAVAQTSPSSPDSAQNPSSTQPSTQNPSSTSPSSTSPTSQQPDTSATGTSSDKGNAVEGCLSGSGGNYTLTDASGSTYQLSGDTSKLADHVGHQVRVWGDTASSSASSSTGSATSSSTSQTLNVKRVKMISSSCPTK